MEASVRRVVTGHTESGKSTVLIDGPLTARPAPHDRFVWTTSETPASNSGSLDAAYVSHRLEPEANGSVFRVVEFPPESALDGLSAEEKRSFFRDLYAKMGALHCVVDTTRSPGMHRTNTIDYVVVLRGEVTLLLEECEVNLKAGDIVVQRGTNHDWVVRGSEPVLLGVVMLSAQPL